MKNLVKLIGIIALVAVIGFSMTACPSDDGGNGGNGGGGGTGNDPTLTGTVTVTSDVTLSGGMEIMTLTADTSGLNSGTYCNFQWIRDSENIGGATSQTYTVTSADYGKTLKVKVTKTYYQGEQFGEFIVPSPTVMNVTVKWHKQVLDGVSGGIFSYKMVIFRRQDGSRLGGTFGVLGATPETVTLTSWSETKFKMVSVFDSVDYFYINGLGDTELFDLINGTKSYTLSYIGDGYGGWLLSATEEK